MRTITSFLIAALLLSLTITATDAKLYIIEKIKYYNVSGKTGKQVHAKFGRRGPWRIRRKHAIAATQREFDFKNFKFKERANKCVLASVDIYLTLTYYYPKWTNRKNASKKLQKLWKIFLKELVRHEKTHGRYFKETTRHFEKELLKTTGKLSNGCRGMTRAARRRLDKAYKKGEARHDAFDRLEKRPTTKIRKLEKALYKAD